MASKKLPLKFSSPAKNALSKLRIIITTQIVRCSIFKNTRLTLCQLRSRTQSQRIDKFMAPSTHKTPSTVAANGETYIASGADCGVKPPVLTPLSARHIASNTEAPPSIISKAPIADRLKYTAATNPPMPMSRSNNSPVLRVKSIDL